MLRMSQVVVGLLTAVVSTHPSLAWSADIEAPPLVRVRSENPSIAAIIREAAERSPIFRRLIERIDATDGLVYVEEGTCGHGVLACLTLSVQVAGPHRLLRILVDPRRDKKDCDFMASIGHELWHAIEVLQEPHVRDFPAAYAFFERKGPTDKGKGRFETPAARRTSLEVSSEVCGRQRSLVLSQASKQLLSRDFER
jgi:hypothetical protein